MKVSYPTIKTVREKIYRIMRFHIRRFAGKTGSFHENMVIFIIATYVSVHRINLWLLKIWEKLREYPIFIILSSRNGIFFLSEKADLPDGRWINIDYDDVNNDVVKVKQKVNSTVNKYSIRHICYVAEYFKRILFHTIWDGPSHNSYYPFSPGYIDNDERW